MRHLYFVTRGLVFAAALAAGGAPALGATWVSWNIPSSLNVPVGSSVTLSGEVRGDGQVDGLELLLTFDRSGSMYKSWSSTKAVAVDLVNQLSEASGPVHVGVIEFTASARVVLQPTPLDTGKNDVIAAINALPGPGGTTGVLNGMDSTRQTFQRSRALGSERKQVGLLISDGFFFSVSSDEVAAQAERDWSLSGISWYVAGVHDWSGEVNAECLQAIAAAGNGTYEQVVEQVVMYGIPVGMSKIDAAVTSLAAALGAEASASVEIYRAFLDLPDGTRISEFGLDPDGTFSYSAQVSSLGPNTFTLTAYGTDGSWEEASLTLYGVPASAPVSTVPEPGTLILLATGLGTLAARKRRTCGRAR